MPLEEGESVSCVQLAEAKHKHKLLRTYATPSSPRVSVSFARRRKMRYGTSRDVHEACDLRCSAEPAVQVCCSGHGSEHLAYI
jgi:hypothetical protein